MLCGCSPWDLTAKLVPGHHVEGLELGLIDCVLEVPPFPLGDALESPLPTELKQAPHPCACCAQP